MPIVKVLMFDILIMDMDGTWQWVKLFNSFGNGHISTLNDENTLTLILDC